jgi:pre-mRNA-processing factor 40
LLRSIQPPVDPATRWDSIKNLICEEISFTAFDSEEDRVRCFDNYVDSLAEACGHHHSKLKKKKEKKKKSKREEVFKYFSSFCANFYFYF